MLYSFTGGADGGWPYAGVIRDSAGNLYGTAGGGIVSACQRGCGVVYKLDTAGRETVLYTFTGGADGANPLNRHDRHRYEAGKVGQCPTPMPRSHFRPGRPLNVPGWGFECVVVSFEQLSEANTAQIVILRAHDLHAGRKSARRSSEWSDRCRKIRNAGMAGPK